MALELDLGRVVTTYQQQLADAQLRTVVAETWVEQYRAEIERLNAKIRDYETVPEEGEADKA